MKKPPPKPTPSIPLLERPTVTIDEFCKLIGFGRSTFYKAVDAGDINPRKYGKRTFITQDEVKRFVESMPVSLLKQRDAR
jgi:excisionase family DNA binding protein